MKPEELKRSIALSIIGFSQNDLTNNSLNLFDTLGYNTERRSHLQKKSFDYFSTLFITPDSKFNQEKAVAAEWNYIDLLFQLTKDEASKQNSLFDTKQVVTKGDSQSVIETYLFFVIALKGETYTRGQLAEITREVNKLFPMPVMILFKYNNYITLSIINRRLHKKDSSKDVLEKVTLIKDIKIPSHNIDGNDQEITHRAHIEILYDLSFDKLYDQNQFKNFVDLHNAWQKTLDTKELNKKFFSELANWYFWAVDKTVWPDDVEKKKEIRNATNVIRLITRLIFVWFLKEKNLVPYKLFLKTEVEKLLKFNDTNKSSYYKAILQNLFFATLNTEMGKRKFRNESDSSRNAHYFIHNLFRYKSEFINPDETLKKYFDPIPFLNGGLFECLDDTNGKVRIDGFSDRKDNVIKVPDELFFLEKEKEVDLNKIYGTKNKRYKVRGLLEILNSYKFTITENTPIEEEVALDPELLGKVFENLLASYNPETQTTARKQTGSFYTPREIVNYMVDESIIAYLKTKMMEGAASFVQVGSDQADMFGNKARVGQVKIEEELTPTRWTDKETELENELRKLISYSDEQHKFTPQETELLIEAIDNCKILDPACGSGAFPMGVLHKLVHILHKLDPENEKWKELQRKKAVTETEEVFHVDANSEREILLKEINETFDTNINYPDYGRKIYLIENCLFGVDIQPIAVQIAKLRFFISLLIEQKVDWTKPDKNYNIKSLPNLETKVVAANTLIGIEKPEGFNFRNKQVEEKEKELSIVRHKHFNARNYKKKVELRKEDERLRKQIGEIIKKEYEHFCTGVTEDIKREQIKINSGKKSIKELEKSGKSEGYVKEQKEKYSKVIKSSEKLIEKLTSQIENNSAIESTADKIANWDPYNHNTYAEFFDSEWMFGLTKGFDLIIGNPPYGIVFDKAFKLIYENIYPTFKRNNDIYVAFIECSLALLCDKGILDFITPNTYLNGDYFKSLREYLKEKSTILQIVDFKNSKIFQDPTVFVSISIIRRSNSIYLPYYYVIKISNELFSKTDDTLNKVQEINDAPFKPHNSLIETITTAKNKYFVIDEKYYVKDVGFNYWTIGKGKKRDGNSIGDRIFYSGERKNKKDKPYLKGKDVDKYLFRDPSNYLRHNYEDYLEEGVDLFRYSKDILEISPKIIYRQTSNKIIAAIDYAKNLCDKTVHIIVPKYPSESLLFITALLNSKLFDYIYKDISQEMEGRTFAQVKTTYIKKLPIVKTDNEIRFIIETIVSYIIFLKQRLDNKYLQFEYLIDAMVYELYFPEEIKAAGCEVLKHLTDLPELKEEWSDEKKLKTIEKVYKELSNPNHPVSIAMFKMDTVEEVRIIEGLQ